MTCAVFVIVFKYSMVEMTKHTVTAEEPYNQDTIAGKSIILPNSFIHRLIHYMGKEEIRQKLNEGMIDPLLNHIMKRIFPYIALTCVLCILLLVVVLLTLGIIISHLRNPVSIISHAGTYR